MLQPHLAFCPPKRHAGSPLSQCKDYFLCLIPSPLLLHAMLDFPSIFFLFHNYLSIYLPPSKVSDLPGDISVLLTNVSLALTHQKPSINTC